MIRIRWRKCVSGNIFQYTISESKYAVLFIIQPLKSKPVTRYAHRHATGCKSLQHTPVKKLSSDILRTKPYHCLWITAVCKEMAVKYTQWRFKRSCAFRTNKLPLLLYVIQNQLQLEGGHAMKLNDHCSQTEVFLHISKALILSSGLCHSALHRNALKNREATCCSCYRPDK